MDRKIGTPDNQTPSVSLKTLVHGLTIPLWSKPNQINQTIDYVNSL